MGGKDRGAEGCRLLLTVHRRTGMSAAPAWAVAALGRHRLLPRLRALHRKYSCSRKVKTTSSTANTPTCVTSATIAS